MKFAVNILVKITLLIMLVIIEKILSLLFVLHYDIILRHILIVIIIITLLKIVLVVDFSSRSVALKKIARVIILFICLLLVVWYYIYVQFNIFCKDLLSILKIIWCSFCTISGTVHSRISSKVYVFLIVKFIVEIVHLPSIVTILTKFRTIKIVHFFRILWNTFCFMIVLNVSFCNILS